MASYFSRPFGGLPSSHLAQLASFGAINTSTDPALNAVANAAARPNAKPLASQSQTPVPNAYDIYAKRKARRVEVQHEDHGEPEPVRNLRSSHDIAALYARRAQARTEWTENQIAVA